MFREPIYKVEICAILVCFCGVITIALHGSKNASDDIEEEGEEKSSNEIIFGYCIIFVCSWIFASNCVLNRALKTVHHSIVMFWHGMCGMILASLGVAIEASVKREEPVRFFHFESRVYWLMIAGMAFDSLGVNS